MPLFSAGDGAPTGAGRTTELTVKDAIRPAAFSAALDALPAGTVAAAAYYGEGAAARLVVRSGGADVPASDIECLNLSGWATAVQPAGKVVGVDVARGRLIRGSARDGEELLVTWCEGTPAEVGGGQYDRGKWHADKPKQTHVPPGPAGVATALTARTGPSNTLVIDDNRTYLLPADITLAAGEHLTIEALDQRRPHLQAAGGVLTIKTTGKDASLTLNGVLLEGGIHVVDQLRTLRILHTTLVPGRSVEQDATSPPPTGPSLVVEGGPPSARINTRLEVQVAFSITGALRIPSHITRLWLLDSLIDGIVKAGADKGIAIADDDALADKVMSGPPLHIERTTILGETRCFDLELASESIFSGRVRSDRRQSGCVRFSYVAPGSSTPQQYRCQPALEIATEAERLIAEAEAKKVPLPTNWDKDLEAEVETWLVPSFEDVEYGQPPYAQLRRTCPEQIRTGAEDGSEMGVYCLLKQPQREANLRLRLDEYLPIGLDAGLITVT